ncbi:TPA: leucine-rich repeat domain-containing protein [Listeria monocytogenes]
MKKFYLSFLTITLVINMIIPLSIPVHAATEESAEWSDSKSPRTMTEYEEIESDDVPTVAEQKIPIKETGMTAQETKPIVKNEIVQNGTKTYNDYFPDDNLASEVAKTRSANARDEVTPEELAQITSLYAHSKGIKDATGIEYLTGLKSLNLMYNQLTSVDVSSNVALTYLDVSNNQLTSIDVSSNIALTYLDVSNNQLTSIDVSSNIALTYLHLSDNQLTSIDVSSNVALTSLYLSDNQLTSIDVSNNKALEFLECCGNELTSIDVSNNKVLKYLNPSDNKLTGIDVSNNKVLEYLNLYLNELTSIDVSSNVALTEIDLGNNELSSIDLSSNVALEYLYLNDNQLTTIDVSSNVALIDLYLSDNQLTSIDVSSNVALRYLNLEHNQLTSIDVSNNVALYYLYLDYNQLTSIDVSNNVALIDLDLMYNRLTSIDVSNNVALDWLSVSLNNIRDISTIPDNISSYFADGQELEEPVQVTHQSTLVYTVPNDILDKNGDLVPTIHPENGGVYDATTRTITWENLDDKGEVTYTFASNDSVFTGIVTIPYAEKEAISIASDDEISYEEEISKTEADFLTDIHASVSPASETLTSNFTDVVDLMTPGDYKVTLSVGGSDITKEVTVHVTKKSSEDTPVPPVPPKDDTNENGKDNGQTSENNQVKVTENELPKTGDSNHMLLGIFMLFIALLVIKIPKKTYREDAE